MKSFHEATIEDMESYAVPTIRAKPDEIILHIGTNDLQKSTARQIAEGIVNLADNISQNCKSNIVISSVIKRVDKPELNLKQVEVNDIFKKFCANRGWTCIKHNNIGQQSSHFNHSGLHLSQEGNSLFASNLIKHFISKTN